MSSKANGVNYSRTRAAKSRRERVIVKLEAQLKVGDKVSKTNNMVIEQMTDSDIRRVEKELATLKSRV